MHTLYAAFDIFPGRKGAQAHIARTIEAVTRFSGRATLACLGTPDMPSWQEEGPVTIRRCRALHPNFLRRTMLFGDFLTQASRAMPHPDVVHFRDIWSGLPLLNAFEGRSRTVFEVNGLPSVELPVHYPSIIENNDLMTRIRSIEDRCLERSDRVLTVSSVTAEWLAGRGIPRDKITVIPNVAPATPEQPFRIEEVEQLAGKHKRIILYTGTVTPWQGIDVLLEAFKYIIDEMPEAHLVIAASVRKYTASLLERIEALRLRKHVLVLGGLEHEQAQGLYRYAEISAAPLISCARNEVQGCCPLKIVESMAAGCPVAASDLAVCRELITHDVDGILVAPGSARALAAAVLRVLRDRTLAERISGEARKRAAQNHSLDAMTTGLHRLYIN